MKLFVMQLTSPSEVDTLYLREGSWIRGVPPTTTKLSEARKWQKEGMALTFGNKRHYKSFLDKAGFPWWSVVPVKAQYTLC